jgi:hypothetical protein
VTCRLGCHLEERDTGIAASQCVSAAYRGVDSLIRKSGGIAGKEPEYWLADCKSKFLKATFRVREVAVG